MKIILLVTFCSFLSGISCAQVKTRNSNIARSLFQGLILEAKNQKEDFTVVEITSSWDDAFYCLKYDDAMMTIVHVFYSKSNSNGTFKVRKVTMKKEILSAMESSKRIGLLIELISKDKKIEAIDGASFKYSVFQKGIKIKTVEADDRHSDISIKKMIEVRSILKNLMKK